MPLELAVDAERLVAQYLRSVGDLAALVAGRVYTDLDRTKPNTYPLIRITRTGGLSPYPQHLDYPRIYIECFGNDKAQAHAVMVTARAAMLQIVRPHPLGVVTSADEISGPVWLPDEFGAGSSPLARYVFSFALTTHPST